MVKYLLAVFLVVWSAQATAKADDWITAHKSKIENLDKAKNCIGLFGLLWLEAKKGNRQARYLLMQYIYPPPHHPRMELSGHAESVIDSGRDTMILAVHSLGMENETTYEKEGSNWRKVAMEFAVDKTENFEFYKCYESGKSGECTKLAVQKDIVPDFSIFAAEIDKYADKGAKPTCYYGDDVQLNITGE